MDKNIFNKTIILSYKYLSLMKITENINLGGLIFTIDNDALLKLQNYLNSIERYFGAKEESEEILADIEARIADLFQSQLCKNKEVVTLIEVNQAIEILGRPEDFGTSGAKKTKYQSIPTNTTYKRLYRNPEQSIIGGVCSGFGLYFNIDPIIIRIIFVLLGFFAGGVILYIVLWIVLPPAVSYNDKLEMKGLSTRR
jgi:phage shock protein PspC (stress-responsive transcriptional regulator)